MKRNLIVLSIAAIIGGYSCEAVKTTPEPFLNYYFQSAFCDSLSLFHLNREVMVWDGIEKTYYNPCKETHWDSYCLNMSVGSIKESAPGVFTGISADARDDEMEFQIRRQMIDVDGFKEETYAPDEATGMFGVVDYRIEAVKDISISSISTMFGKEPGTPLNSFFGMRTEVIPAIFLHYIDFVFSRDRILVDRLSRIESIEDYLALYPIINPYLTFYLREKPKEVPLETQFTITVTMEDGRVLCETSDLIKLLQ